MSTLRQWREPEIAEHVPDCLAARYPSLYGCFCAEHLAEAAMKGHVAASVPSASAASQLAQREEYAHHLKMMRRP